jgi:hypothetical protein
VGFLLVGTYMPWSGSGYEPPRTTPGISGDEAPRPGSRPRVKAVVRTHDGRLLTFTQAPSLAALGVAKQPLALAIGIKQRSRNGVSLLFPAVSVNIHL